MLAFSVFFDTGTFMPKKRFHLTTTWCIEFITLHVLDSSRRPGSPHYDDGFASYMTHIGANDTL